MELKIYQWENKRWSVIWEGDRKVFTISYLIADELNIREREFDSIVDRFPHDGGCYFYSFETRELARDFLDALEAFAIMKKLTEVV